MLRMRPYTLSMLYDLTVSPASRVLSVRWGRRHATLLRRKLQLSASSLVGGGPLCSQCLYYASRNVFPRATRAKTCEDLATYNFVSLYKISGRSGKYRTAEQASVCWVFPSSPSMHAKVSTYRRSFCCSSKKVIFLGLSGF